MKNDHFQMIYISIIMINEALKAAFPFFSQHKHTACAATRELCSWLHLCLCLWLSVPFFIVYIYMYLVMILINFKLIMIYAEMFVVYWLISKRRCCRIQLCVCVCASTTAIVSAVAVLQSRPNVCLLCFMLFVVATFTYI